MDKTTTQKYAVLDLEGATCTSCSIAIEHLGRKLDGVKDIFVDRGTNTIQMAYDGNDEVVTKVSDFVDRLGYKAVLRSTGEA
jgi:copper chaperone CopZ